MSPPHSIITTSSTTTVITASASTANSQHPLQLCTEICQDLLGGQVVCCLNFWESVHESCLYLRSVLTHLPSSSSSPFTSTLPDISILNLLLHLGHIKEIFYLLSKKLWVHPTYQQVEDLLEQQVLFKSAILGVLIQLELFDLYDPDFFKPTIVNEEDYADWEELYSCSLVRKLDVCFTAISVPTLHECLLEPYPLDDERLRQLLQMVRQVNFTNNKLIKSLCSIKESTMGYLIKARIVLDKYRSDALGVYSIDLSDKFVNSLESNEAELNKNRVSLIKLAENRVELIQKKIAAMRTLSFCANLVKVEGYIHCEDSFIAVTEYISNNLSSLLQSNVEFDRLELALGVANGLTALHSCQVLHKSLSSLVVWLRPDLSVALSDYDLTRFVQSDAASMGLNDSTSDNGNLAFVDSPTCPPYWKAPELYKQEVFDGKCDVYSLGVVLWEIATRRLPFNGETDNSMLQVLKENSPDDLFNQISSNGAMIYGGEDLEKLIKACLSVDPSLRPTAAQVVEKLKEIRSSHQRALKEAAKGSAVSLSKLLVNAQGRDLEGNNAFHLAVRSRNLAMAELLLSNQPALINSKQAQGWTALHFAVDAQDLSLVQWLLSSGADPALTNKEGRTALHFAALVGNLDICSVLCSTSSDIMGVTDGQMETGLHLAARGGHLSVLSFLVRGGQECVNVQNAQNKTALHIAANAGYLECCQELVRGGVTVELTDADGLTGYDTAIKAGQLHVAIWLEGRSSKELIRIGRHDGWSLLHIAVEEGDLNIVKWLCQHGQDVNGVSNLNETTPLHIAVANQRVKVVKYLLDAGAKVDAQQRNGGTPIQVAVCLASAELLSLLTSAGADLSVVDSMNSGLIDFATKYGLQHALEFLVQVQQVDLSCSPLRLAVQHLDLVKWLVLEKKASLSTLSPDELEELCFKAGREGRLDILELMTPQQLCPSVLHVAAEAGHLAVVKWMVEQGFNIDAPLPATQVTPLFKAIERGQFVIVKWMLIEGKANTDMVDQEGNTILHLAASTGLAENTLETEEMVKWLVVELKMDVHRLNRDGQTLLHCACRSGNQSLVKWLVEQRWMSVNAKDHHGNSCLHFAAASGKLDLVKWLMLERGMDETAMNERGETPAVIATRNEYLDLMDFFTNVSSLNSTTIAQGAATDDINTLHAAALFGQLDIMGSLALEQIMDVSKVDQDGRTILHLAGLNGHLETLFFLLKQQKMDPNLTDNYGHTVLHLAACNGHFDVVSWLIQDFGMNPYDTDHDGNTPLHQAAWRGHANIVEWLIRDANVPPTVANGVGDTPLHLAAWKGFFVIVKWLVGEAKVSVNLIDLDGDTPFHLAARKGHFSTVKWLVNQPTATIGAVDKDGDTVLHQAAWCGHLEMVKWLIMVKGMNPGTLNKIGDSVLFRAAKKGHLEVVKWLISSDKRLDYTSVNYSGVSLLHYASASGNLELVKWAVERLGLSVYVLDNQGSSVINWAKDEDIATWLMSKNSKRRSAFLSFFSTSSTPATAKD